MHGSSAQAVIVGMGPGLSTALARRFASGGLRVAGLARNPGRSAALTTELAGRGQRLVCLQADAGDPPRLARVLALAEQDHGPVEALIYNAFGSTLALPTALSPESLVDDFRINVAGALAAVQAVLPGMMRRGRGTLLLTGGGLALDPRGWPQACSLAIGKAGLRSLSLSLARELEATPVRVCTVTIDGPIGASEAFAAERIAECFWNIHTSRQPVAAEVLFDGQ